MRGERTSERTGLPSVKQLFAFSSSKLRANPTALPSHVSPLNLCLLLVTLTSFPEYFRLSYRERSTPSLSSLNRDKYGTFATSYRVCDSPTLYYLTSRLFAPIISRISTQCLIFFLRVSFIKRFKNFIPNDHLL